MRRTAPVLITLFALGALLAGCGDDPSQPAPTFDLTFTGDATFQGAHGGQTIHVGVREQGSGELVADMTGTVSSTADPAFSFSFEQVLVEGTSYYLDYWIDSNFGGGQEGTCDSPDIDHQWRMSIPSVSEDVVIDDTHRPTETEPVCSESNSDDGIDY